MRLKIAKYKITFIILFMASICKKEHDFHTWINIAFYQSFPRNIKKTVEKIRSSLNRRHVSKQSFPE